MRKNPLKKQVYRYIETELSSYHETKKLLSDAINDILLESPTFDDSGIRSTDTSDPTFNRAVSLITNVRLNRIEKTVRAIERVLSELGEGKLKLIELRYWQNRYTDAGIWPQLNIERATYYNWKNNIIFRLAKEMGYL